MATRVDWNADEVLTASARGLRFVVAAKRRTLLVFQDVSVDSVDARGDQNFGGDFKLLCRISGCQTETYALQFANDYDVVRMLTYLLQGAGDGVGRNFLGTAFRFGNVR